MRRSAWNILDTLLDFVLPVVVGIMLDHLALAGSPELLPMVPVRTILSTTVATQLDLAREPLVRVDLPLVSAQSCVAASCHGGAHPGIARQTARRGAEYPLWLEKDPHARSWQTICSDQSVAIMRRLKIMVQDQIVDRAGFENCLACHDTSRGLATCNSHSHSHVGSPLAHEGVGCVACHGPDGGWVSQHYRYPLDVDVESGFVNNRNYLTRARMCATCHVGDRDRDMNHDIIAAGHPALRYEFATYHARQPKHWRDDEECDPSCYETQLWLAGQIAALDASLTLLETRASDSHTVSVWPEFAEYDCASCHHEMRSPDLAGPQRRGLPRYSAWNRAGLEMLLEFAGNASAEEQQLRDRISNLQAVMEATRTPDPDAVAAATRDARLALDRWLQSHDGFGKLRTLDADRLTLVTETCDRHETASWEAAAQMYLARIAARTAWSDGPNGQNTARATAWRESLRFPAGRDGADHRFLLGP